MEEYFVIHPTTIQKKKVTLGDSVELTESQARPLVNGGFVTRDKGATDRIITLTKDLKSAQESNTTEDQ